MSNRYWASRDHHMVGPFDTREEAAAALFAAHEVDFASTGWGTYGPHFDIRFIDNPQWLAILTRREEEEAAGDPADAIAEGERAIDQILDYRDRYGI